MCPTPSEISSLTIPEDIEYIYQYISQKCGCSLIHVKTLRHECRLKFLSLTNISVWCEKEDYFLIRLIGSVMSLSILEPDFNIQETLFLLEKKWDLTGFYEIVLDYKEWY